MEFHNPREYKFCPKCGNELIKKFIENEQTNRIVCSKCHYIFYINPTPAVAVILLKNNKVCLVKRKYEPQKGGWTLPAGFMEYNESSEQTAMREVKEETNLNIEIKKIFGIYPSFDDPGVHVILIVYSGTILNSDLTPGDDAEDVSFFPLNDLPTNIAFSAHKIVLNKLNEDFTS